MLHRASREPPEPATVTTLCNNLRFRKRDSGRLIIKFNGSCQSRFLKLCIKRKEPAVAVFVGSTVGLGKGFKQ